MTEHIDNLTIDFEADGSLTLEQDCTGNISHVYLHPIQLRYLAEKAGLVETSDPQAARIIARLKRQMLALNERIQHLDHWLSHCSDTEHANLDYEQTYAAATADIADEFCTDLLDTAPPPPAPAPSKPDASAVQTPPPATTGQPAPFTPQPSLI